MRFARFARCAATLAAVLGLSHGAHAQSMPTTEAPPPAKAAELQQFKVAPGSIPAASVRLEGPAQAAIEAVKQGNSAERLQPLQIGIGQEVAGATASDKALLWMPAPGGMAAHWQVSSREAKALRVALEVTHMPPGAELRFAGSAAIATVYGPATATDILKLGSPYWSPVLEGDTATIEVFVPAGTSRPVLAIGHVSHLFVSPSHPRAEQLAKASGACEVDFICRAAGDAQLAQVGRSVAKMTFIKDGSSLLCTGTLLVSADYSFTPYFYTAAHCINTSSVANTLTTHWFYENTTCRGSVISPSYVQVGGGATLLYASTVSDASFMRLNSTPPPGAVYAGWDAATLAPGTAMTAVHHPAGDPKKVSVGSVGGLGPASTDLAPPGGSFLIINWNSPETGVTEPGSNGSGIFSRSASEGYHFRGGLLGGPSSCTAAPTERYDYYSRFDQAYGFISRWLNPESQGLRGPNVVANPGFESGAASWTQSSSAGASIIANDAGNAHVGNWYARLGGVNSVSEALIQDIVVPIAQPQLQFWYRIITNEAMPSAFDTLTVTVESPSSGGVLATLIRLSNEHASGSWTQSPIFDLSPFVGQTVRLRFAVNTDPTEVTTFRIDDVFLTGDASTSTNYTALWWNAPGNSESGWGMNFVQQGDIAFATLFTYDLSGAPMWLFMSRGERQGSADSFSGPLYRATGPAFFSRPFTSIGPGNLTQVGTMTVAFSGANSGTLTYSVNGVSVTKSITKQVYGTAAAHCFPAPGSRASATNYQDLWWNYPANSESGWGLNITHQGNILFGTLFTYDANNRDLWLVMSRGERQPDGSYFGELYQTTGPPFNAQPWGPFGVTQVGTMRLTFSSGEMGTLEYTAFGRFVTKTITRQLFSNPLPLCVG